MVKKINNPIKTNVNNLEKISLKVTNWVGTPSSIVAHTIFFVGIFALEFIGFSLDKILLILTTAVSLEAIYLAIFIQMTVNRQAASIQDIEEDIEDIQEDVEDLSEDVEDISEDIDEYHTEGDEDEGQITKLVKKGISELRSKHII